jgi:hypothetical protein
MCRENERTHKHHIIPRYMGGTDAAENLVEVTVTQHAMYHFCNYQLWGNEEDKIAWCALGGQISFDEARLEAMKLGSKKSLEVKRELLKNEEYRKNLSETYRNAFNKSPYKNTKIKLLQKLQPMAIELARSPEAIEKKKNTFREIKHQQGEKNSQYGKMWITNGTKEGTYRINKGEPIPEGYWKGRVCYDGEEHIEKCFAKYIYTIITPEGETIITKNLEKFCRERYLKSRSMQNVCKGHQKTHKGYKVTREPINTHKISNVL